jgi:hypothetical protein
MYLDMSACIDVNIASLSTLIVSATKQREFYNKKRTYKQMHKKVGFGVSSKRSPCSRAFSTAGPFLL